jgi:hypothetical protein
MMEDTYLDDVSNCVPRKGNNVQLKFIQGFPVHAQHNQAQNQFFDNYFALHKKI